MTPAHHRWAAEIPRGPWRSRPYKTGPPIGPGSASRFTPRQAENETPSREDGKRNPDQAAPLPRRVPAARSPSPPRSAFLPPPAGHPISSPISRSGRAPGGGASSSCPRSRSHLCLARELWVRGPAAATPPPVYHFFFLQRRLCLPARHGLQLRAAATRRRRRLCLSPCPGRTLPTLPPS